MDLLNQKVSLCESILDYTFTNRTLCAEALNTSGTLLVWENASQALPRNQRIAIYGDSVIRAQLCRQWWHATNLTKGIIANRHGLLKHSIQSWKLISRYDKANGLPSSN
jgi:hypothetical protein